MNVVVYGFVGFARQFEKRVKKALKERKLRKGEKVLVAGELAGYLVKKIIKLPAKFTFSKSFKKGYRVIITQQTLDDVCVDFLARFGGRFNVSENDNNVIKALKFVTDEDAVRYARLNCIKFKPGKKDKLWADFLAQFPVEMKYNLIRNAKEMEQIWSRK